MRVRLTIHKYMRQKVWQRLGKPTWVLTAAGDGDRTWTVDTGLLPTRKLTQIGIDLPRQEVEAVRVFTLRAGPSGAQGSLVLKFHTDSLRRVSWRDGAGVGLVSEMNPPGNVLHTIINGLPPGATPLCGARLVDVAAALEAEAEPVTTPAAEAVRAAQEPAEPPAPSLGVVVVAEAVPAELAALYAMASNISEAAPATAEAPAAAEAPPADEPDPRAPALAATRPTAVGGFVFPHVLNSKRQRATPKAAVAYLSAAHNSGRCKNRLNIRLADHVLGRAGWRGVQRVQVGVSAADRLIHIMPVDQLDEGYLLGFQKACAVLTFQLHTELGIEEFDGLIELEVRRVDEKGVLLKLPDDIVASGV